MVKEGDESSDIVVRVRFGEEAVIIEEETRSLGETCARPGPMLRGLRWVRDSALDVIKSRGWLETGEVPTGLEYQVGLPAGFSYRGPLPPNAISIEPFLSKKPDTNPPETDGLPN